MARSGFAGRPHQIGMIVAAALSAIVVVAGIAAPAHAASTGASYRLYGVSCASAKSCTAVGGTGQYISAGSPLVRAWNGRRWTTQRAGRHAILLSVACRSRKQCTAVGETNSQRALVLRWTGTRWAAQRTPSTGTGSLSYASLQSVACPAAATCMAVGVANRRSLAERWNGTSWTIEAVPLPATAGASALFGVTCHSTADCTAVGNYITGEDHHQPLVEHWDGTAWAAVPTPEADELSELVSVSCPSATSCVAVGNSPVGEGPPLPLAEAWHGGTWTILPTAPHPDAYAQFNGVACTSARFCLAVGLDCTSADICANQGQHGFRALAERWNGTKWTVLRMPSPAEIDLQSVSCTSWRACTAVGRSKTALLAEHWNGTRWTRESVPG